MKYEILEKSNKPISEAGISCITIRDKETGEKYAAKYLWYIIDDKIHWKVLDLKIKGEGYELVGDVAMITIPDDALSEIFYQATSIVSEAIKPS